MSEKRELIDDAIEKLRNLQDYFTEYANQRSPSYFRGKTERIEKMLDWLYNL